MIKFATGRMVVLAIVSMLVGVAVGLVGVSYGAEQLQEYLAEDHMSHDVGKVPPSEVAMVLGTAPILAPDWHVNPDFTSRLDAAAALWKAGTVKYLLVSGNGTQPGQWDETTNMRRGLIDRGVPAEAIYRDDRGLRTWDSVVRARDLFGQKRLVIVSQRSHVARALYLASSLGIDAYGLEVKGWPHEDDLYGLSRPFLAAVLAYFDAWRGSLPRLRGAPVIIGFDPAN
jgi:SanA protein